MTLITTLLMAVFIVLLIAVALLLSPRSASSGVNIRLGSRGGATVKVDGEGVTIGPGKGKMEITFTEGEEAQDEPEIVGVTRPYESSDASFLARLNDYDHLTVEEKQQVLRTLASYGFIHVDDIEKYSIRENDAADDDGETTDDIDLEPGADAGMPGGEEDAFSGVNHEFDS